MMSDHSALIPPELASALPALYATENDGDPIVQAKLFLPWSNWTWFLSEYDGDDLCFGLVCGQEIELGYFSLSELEALEGPAGLRIERDLYFAPKPLSEVRSELSEFREPGRLERRLSSDGIDDRRRRVFNSEADPMLVKKERVQGLLPLGISDQDREIVSFPSPLENPGVMMIETRIAETCPLPKGAVLQSPRDAARILESLIGDADREHFVALYLNSRHVVTHAHIVSCGTSMSAPVHPREVFKAAVLSNAAAIVVGHNHPSGDVRPSGQDKIVNERLKKAGGVMGIEVLDALIVGPKGRFYALSEDKVFRFVDGVVRPSEASLLSLDL